MLKKLFSRKNPYTKAIKKDIVEILNEYYAN